MNVTFAQIVQNSKQFGVEWEGQKELSMKSIFGRSNLSNFCILIYFYREQLNLMKPVIKTKSKLQVQLNRFNQNSFPLPSLKLPQKIQILSLEMSVNNGQGGVIFIELREGSFIVKPSISIPNQLFYNELAIELGIRVPQITFFSNGDSAYFKIFEAIEIYCGQRDECLFARIKAKFNNLFYGVIQYIPSVSFQCLGRLRFQKLMTSPQKIYQIGTCLGYDIIINNQDRFQLLWGGEGNVGNVLIQVPNHHQHSPIQLKQRQNVAANLNSYVLIDNEGHMLDVKMIGAANYVTRYFQKVAKFLRQILQDQLTNNAQSENLSKNMEFLKLINQIQLYTGHKLSNAQLKQVSYGIIDVIQKFVSAHKAGSIQKIYNRIYKFSKKIQCVVISQQWISQLKNISMNYCDSLIANIKPILKEYNEKRKKNNMSHIQNQVSSYDNQKQEQYEDIEIEVMKS